MILVTGAYGFIGSNFVKLLNSQGISDIDVSDYLDNGHQFVNLKSASFNSYIHPDNVDVSLYNKIFHFGGISDTTCWDGNLVMSRNYSYTKHLIDQCIKNKVFLSYSSSASVYGNGNGPLNLYAYSKYLIDQYVEKMQSPLTQGFRYFNVYSLDDSEWHKKDQASPYYKFKHQSLSSGSISIFEGSENFYRDFVHVDTVCKIQWDMSHRKDAGIFDLGSGKSISFLDVATEISNLYGGKVETIPFPEKLKGCYQTNTLADMSYL